MKFNRSNRIKSLWLIAALCLCYSTASEAAKRALLIGNNAYLHARPLVNARNDAVRLGEVLNGLGWQTTVLQDLTSDRMKRALRDFKATLREGDEVVFHFSGHGAEFEQSSFLLPVDVEPTNRELVKDDAIRLRRVMDDFEQQRVRFSFLVIDACRDDPFAKGLDGSLSPESDGVGSLVLYAARAKEVALDRLSATDRDPNGVLTRVLLQEIVKRGVTLSAVAKQTQRRVHELARSVGKTQLPNISDTLLGEYYFLGADGPVIAPGSRPGMSLQGGEAASARMDGALLAFADLARKATVGDAAAVAALERNPMFVQLRSQLKLDARPNGSPIANQQSVALSIAQAQSIDPDERALGEAMVVYLRTFPNIKELKNIANHGNPYAALMLDFEYRSSGRDEEMDYRFDNSNRWKELIARALPPLQKMAESGNSIAQIWLANRYRADKKDAEKSEKLYQQAASKGNVFAYYCVGKLHLDQGNLEKAFFWFTKGADDGDAWAMGQLASLYAGTNSSMPANHVLAIQWYERAIAAGDIWAMGQLGGLYQVFKGIPRSEAVRKSVEWLERGVAAGDQASTRGLAETYSRGIVGLPQDHARAIPLYELAANAAPEQYALELANWYAQGNNGFPKNGDKAEKWYEQAVLYGGSSAIFKVAEVYADGRGVVKKNETKALPLLRQAARAGNYEAMLSIAAFYGQGLAGQAKDHPKAMEWYGKAVEAGGAKAMYQLAMRYEDGRGGLEQDHDKALKWYSQAAALGHGRAKDKLEDLQRRLEPQR